MAFTNVWDTTQPPDTQLANLLGQDLRNLKKDIQERMAVSGTLANRPTLEGAPNANFTGFLYWAVDTKQIFQWNGTTWVDVSGSFAGSSGSIVDYDNNVINNTPPIGVAQSVLLPIGSVQASAPQGSFIEIITAFNISSFFGPFLRHRIQVVGIAEYISDFNIIPGNTVIRATVSLTNATTPIVSSQMITSQGGAAGSAYAQAGQFLSGMDNLTAYTINSSFALASTVTGVTFFLHARVRK